MGVVWDRYRVCLYGGTGKGNGGTEIRDFIFWEGWFRLGGLRTYIGDVNIGGFGDRYGECSYYGGKGVLAQALEMLIL